MVTSLGSYVVTGALTLVRPGIAGFPNMNDGQQTAENLHLPPIQRLSSAYAVKQDKPLFHAAFALDAQLAEVIRSTSEPMIGAIRLQWWRDVMAKPPAERPLGNPVIAALNAAGNADNIALHAQSLIDAWDTLIEAEGDRLQGHLEFAEARGHALFGMFAGLAAPEREADLLRLGRFWAAWDLARHLSDAAEAEAVIGALRGETAWLTSLRLPRRLRPLAILAALARLDMKPGALERPLLRPATALRIMWHGMSGRR